MPAFMNDVGSNQVLGVWIVFGHWGHVWVMVPGQGETLALKPKKMYFMKDGGTDKWKLTRLLDAKSPPRTCN